ncbi:PepSY domain-containing protein [Frigidibacter albus]|uniref:PepSY domain-containing protein n=1 Tax=Frigidibacter albus TaxID=1465486 RepID=A0A6L8VGI5_9RHOB|nr:PepSY domain-containing protein [Frigidibacter albus]MZQ88429.1 PepSY domain-containing protein [Frigidibacter albus]NBE29897.1 PepSY domain-containing protein [Frigidibacter albus]GGH45431.1 sulfite reductase [Frigidibacter albus]
MTHANPRAAKAALYSAIWRWHFIAGLVVLPFMLILAVTGGIYLFKDEINDAAYSRLRFVESAASAPLLPSQITAAALASNPGTLKAYTPAAAADRSAEVDILGADGLKNTVYVDPYTGTVQGSLWDAGASGSPAMHVVRKLHSLDYVGWVGNRLIEAAAGWMVLLVATGIYLWWPRGKKVGTVSIKATRGRPWWRDLHAVTGIYTASFIVFLSMTGLPWSSVWGGKFYDYAYALGLGMPDGYWSGKPASTVPVSAALDRAPWIMENQPMPLSTAAAGVPQALDTVVARVEALGLVPGYAVVMPNGPEGVFTASVYPDDITYERVIHLDQYSGAVLYDADLADLGTLGRWAEWGISVHMGQEFGLVNQIVLLLACAAMVMLCVSAAAMWWKRRPAGALGVPQVPADWRIPRTLLLMAVAAGIFFPLVGLSMLLLAAVELGVFLAGRRLRTA